ncbi:MAG: LysR family transcriptional regulator [Firmicutes bacterium]|nr:LysR family transcriptional regulator [Bacillota bacterium]
MDIKHIEYFLAVARCKSFTKAAQMLYVTQPTISKMIKNIEEDLNVVLFNRLGKEIELTDAGQVFFSYAQNIFSSVRNMSVELDDMMHLKNGNIKIGLPPMVGSSFFPRVIGKFHELYPEVAIELTETGAKKVEADVDIGTLDIGVTLLPIDEALFDWFPFVEENLMLLVPVDHAMANRDAVRLAELEQESFALLNRDFVLHDRIIFACEQVGFKPKIIFESSQWDFIGGIVAANLGIALLPGPICRKLDISHVRAIPLIEPTISWNLAVIWRAGRYLSFAAREWLRFTRSFLSERANLQQ